MNRFFFRDLLEGNPQLLERMLAFNRTAKKDAALPAGGIWEAVRRQPDLMAALTARMPTAPAEGAYWSFTDESERLAFFPPEVLGRIGRIVSAAVYAEDIAHSLVKSDVMALRSFLGADIYTYALTRGRYQVGSLRPTLAGAVPDGTLAERCTKLARQSLETVRAGWPEELQHRSERLFASVELPEATPLDDTLRQPLWYFMKKLILRELDQEWIRYFD